MKGLGFTLAFLYLALFGFLSFLLFREEVPKIIIYISYGIAIVSVVSLGWERMESRKDNEISRYIARIERQDISRGVSELKDLQKKESTGKITANDYLHYIVSELQGIRIKMGRMKNINEEIIDYFQKIKNIPEFYNKEEWLESENDIFKRLIAQVKENLAARGLARSGSMDKYLGVLKKEREKYLKAKERTFK